MQNAKELLKKYQANDCTEQELNLLRAWFDNLHMEEDSILQEDELLEAKEAFKLTYLKQRKSAVYRFRLQIAAAAAIILMLSVGSYFYVLEKRFAKENFKNQEFAFDGKSTILTLADGAEINLSRMKNGSTQVLDGMTIEKTADGELIYELQKHAEKAVNEMHSLETPVGQQYSLVLGDGTKVWLNACTKLRFPTAFAAGAPRHVELVGEAYFEVASSYADATKKKRIPFIVNTKAQDIEVLGTGFNVMAYANELSTKTSLFHGSVRLHPGKEANSPGVILKPGQQGTVVDGKILVSQMDVQELNSWREGHIKFVDKDIYEIMRMLARWYAIEVEYRGVIKPGLYGGTLSKDKDLAEVLTMLEATGELHFELQNLPGTSKGRRVVIMQ